MARIPQPAECSATMESSCTTKFTGTGKPFLLIHGNGGSISDMKAQIDYFRKRNRVITMDSRDQGKPGDSPDRITYEKMADDLAALLDYLKSPPLNVLGRSDGGIEALLLGIHHPDKVDKIAAMGLLPYDDPDLFNSTVERCFDTPFAKKDRIRDALNSLEKMRAAHD